MTRFMRQIVWAFCIMAIWLPCSTASALPQGDSLRTFAHEQATKKIGLTYRVKLDAVSGYIWRGNEYGALAFQPFLSIGYGGLSVSGWFNIGSSNYDFHSTARFYPEVNLDLSFSRCGLILGVKEYHFFTDKFFDYQNTPENLNRLEVYAGYDFSYLTTFPLFITWYTTVAGQDGAAYGLERRYYSTYIEIGTDVPLPKNWWIKGRIGLSPWRSFYSNYEKDFLFKCVSLQVERLVRLDRICEFDIFGQVSLDCFDLKKGNIITSTTARIEQKLCARIGLGLWF